MTEKPQEMKLDNTKQTPKPKEYATIIYFPQERLSEINRITEEIQFKDKSFQFEIRRIRGQFLLIVYSQRKGQSQARGKWLVNKVSPLMGLSYEIHAKGALEEVFRVKPQKVKSLIDVINKRG